MTDVFNHNKTQAMFGFAISKHTTMFADTLGFVPEEDDAIKCMRIIRELINEHFDKCVEGFNSKRKCELSLSLNTEEHHIFEGCYIIYATYSSRYLEDIPIVTQKQYTEWIKGLNEFMEFLGQKNLIAKPTWIIEY